MNDDEHRYARRQVTRAEITPDHGCHTSGFEATAAREGKWWIITVAALDAVTQARNVRESGFSITCARTSSGTAAISQRNQVRLMGLIAWATT